MDPLLNFLLGFVAAVILTGIGILVTIKISRKQKKEAKENTAHLSTYHKKILKNQERQERIQKKLVLSLIWVGGGLSDHPLPTERLVPAR